MLHAEQELSLPRGRRSVPWFLGLVNGDNSGASGARPGPSPKARPCVDGSSWICNLVRSVDHVQHSQRDQGSNNVMGATVTLSRAPSPFLKYM